MFRLSLRTLLAHKARFAMTSFAVLMGVGFVVGAFVVTDTLRRSVDELLETITSVDVTVRATSNLDSGSSGGPATRGRIDGNLAEPVSRVDGVAAAVGQVAGYAQLLDEAGEPVTTSGAPFFGLSWPAEPSVNPATLDVGRPPERPGEVVIDRGTAQDYDFAVGDRTRMLVLDGQVDVEIVGIFTYGASNSLLGARLTGMDPAWAADVLDTGGQVDSVDVVVEPGTDIPEVAARIQTVLPPGVEAVPSQQVVDESQRQVSGLLSVFQNVLLAFAGIAVFVSAFYINNTFAIVLGQRVRELSLVRALGASARQVVTSVLVEAAVIGVVAGAIGVAFGLVIAVALQGLLAAGGFDLPDRALVVSPRTLLAAFVVALPVTVLSALAPARRAARVAPVEGMQSGYRAPDGSRPVRLVMGAVVSVGAVLVVAYGLFVAEETVVTFVALAVGAAGIFLGVASLGPLIAAPVVAALGWPVARVVHPTGSLARANAMRNPFRTSRTAAALMIGLALVTTAFVVGESIKQSFSDAVSGAVTADFVITGGGFSGFSPKVADDLRALPGIDAVTGVRFDRFAIDGIEADITAVDPSAAGEVVDIGLQEGSIADLGPDTVLIHVDPARERGLEVGDTVEVTYASGGPRTVRVAGIYDDATFAGNYVMDLATFTQAYPTNALDFFVFATVASGVDPDGERRAIEDALVAYPQVEVETRDQFNRSQQAQLDQVLVAVNGLLGLALFIALLGIANTLALSVVERTREIGLLRAVGQARGQTRIMVLLEALIVAVFGALAGLLIGLGLGVAAALAMPESFITRVAVPVGSLVAVLVVSAVLGVVAGVLPARRAARMKVLEAINVE